MSLINDALKRARQAPPGNAPTSQPSPQPVNDSSTAAWLIPAVVIFLIVAAIFFIGWAAAHNTVRTIEATPSPVDTQQTSTFVVPVTPPPPPPPSAPEPTPAVKPVLPQLQGIFYSATAPTAILDGKTVGPGDQFKEYRVKTISKDTVTLIGPDKQEVRLSMEN